MIVISEKDDCIVITGHAEYAPRGEDIVCSAISAITETFIESVNELTDDELCDVRNGDDIVTSIRYGDLSKAGQLLKRSFFIGVEMIAYSYPEHVKIDKE